MTTSRHHRDARLLDLAFDDASGQLLVEWNKIPFSPADRPFWAALSAVPGIGPQTLALLVAAFGSARAALAADAKGLSELGVPQRTVAALHRFRRRHSPKQWFRHHSEKHELTLLAAPEPNFPPQLRQWDGGPAQLWVRGDPATLKSSPIVAIVGARKMTPYGRQVTTQIAAGLAAAGCTIVSGLMYGVDETAMRAAIAAGGTAIGVWAGGLTPASLGSRGRLAQDVLTAGGALVSELPPDQRPTPGLFPARNRIVSGLAAAVVVTEGAERSGSLITARFAIEQGRPVCAVPGPVTSALSAGPNGLLKLGVPAATAADDVLELIGRPPQPNSPPESPPQNDRQAAVLNSLALAQRTTDELARLTKLPVSTLSDTLVELELAGRVTKLGRHWILAAKPAGRRAVLS